MNKDIEWVLITHKSYPMFSRVWMNEAFTTEQKHALGMSFLNYKSIYSGIYADKKELEKMRLFLIAKLESDVKEIWRLCKEWEKASDEAIIFSKKQSAQALSNLSDNELVSITEKILEKLRQSAAYIYLHHALSPYFEAWVIQKLDGNVKDASKKNQYFQILTTPKRQTGITQSQNDLKHLAQKIKQKGWDSCKKDIEGYRNLYKWLGYETAIGADLSTKDVMYKVKNTSLNKEIKRTSRSFVEKKLQFNKQEIDMLDLMGEIAYLAKYREESSMKVGVYLRPILEEAARRLKTTYEEIVQLTLPEINQALQTGKINIKLIEKRKHKYGLVTFGGKHTVLTGSEVNPYEEKASITQNIKIVTGIIANLGKVIAPAKIVLGRSDFHKVERGDIVVAKMTTPEYMLVIGKCAGIITDIGGITSHAAIIAREMGKPCITATRIASTYFKDGDMLELDADNGIARRLG